MLIFPKLYAVISYFIRLFLVPFSPESYALNLFYPAVPFIGGMNNR